MFTIYDAECPICRAQKKLIVKRYERPNVERIEHTSFEFWGYVLSENETIVGAFCPECGTKFVTPDMV